MARTRGKTLSDAAFRRAWTDTTKTVGQIGQELGISQQAVSSRAATRNLPARQKGPEPIIAPDLRFKEMWIAGVYIREIATALAVSEKTVRNHATRLDLPRRRGGVNCGITHAQFAEYQLLLRMTTDAAEVKAQWVLAEMADPRARFGKGKR